MRLLFLTFYYPPDLSAGSFRSEALVEALAPNRNDGLNIDIMTTMPNRYHGLKEIAQETEQGLGVSVRRIPVPTHQSGMLDQARSFGTYAREVLRLTSQEEYDAVFATSSRLMTASLATAIGKRKGIPVYLDVRDLFTDTIGDLFAASPLKLTTPPIKALERWTFSSAARISVVSDGFLGHVRRVAPGVPLSCFTNGIDDEFVNRSFANPRPNVDDRLLILYAGNIGEGQGLHNILPEAARILSQRARFRIIGAGGRLARLSEALADVGADVEILPPVPRAQLHEHYREADILFLHLNSHAAFHKVLPSKIFEYGATGKPLLAGLAGSAAHFVRSNLAEGSAVFSPCNALEMVDAFEALAEFPGPIDRSAFHQRYARRAIMSRMAQDLMVSLTPSSIGAR